MIDLACLSNGCLSGIHSSPPVTGLPSSALSRLGGLKFELQTSIEGTYSTVTCNLM